ncbi:MAG: magnesium transporter [Planctomycetota bacterium]
MEVDPGLGAIPKPWLRLAELARRQDAAGLEAFVDQLSLADRTLALGHLEAEDALRVFQLLPNELGADLISQLSEAQSAQLIGWLDPTAAAEVIHELPSDEQADVLGDLEPSQAEAILDVLPASEAAAVRELAAYPDDVAGGLMLSEFLSYSNRLSVAEVIEQLSRDHDRHDAIEIRYGYVCDDAGRLVGVLRMQSLLFAQRSAPVSDVMVSDPVSVSDRAELAELEELFERHPFLAVPVLDSRGRVLGVLEREAVNHQSSRSIENDYLKSQGIVGGEELRTMPLWTRSRRRLSWLSVNIVLNVGAASVVAMYQETLQEVIALAVFLPIISDMSGCSGNQAVAVSMRELSLGLIRPTEVLRVWWQEVSVGLINGTVLAFLVAVVATVFNGNPYLGLVVGVALFVNTIVAVSIGGTIPLVLKRFGVDPAVASGPLLTTVTDMCGFFLVLGLATAMLAQLT